MRLGLGLDLSTPRGLLGPPLLYALGSGSDKWVEGFFDGSGSVAQNADHLSAEVTGNSASGGERTWVTDELVDLTKASTVHVEWEADLPDNSNAVIYLIASTDKDGDQSVSDATLFTTGQTEGGSFARREDTLDVSGLSGNYHIRTHAEDASLIAGLTVTLRVYRVWLS